MDPIKDVCTKFHGTFSLPKEKVGRKMFQWVAVTPSLDGSTPSPLQTCALSKGRSVPKMKSRVFVLAEYEKQW